MGTVVIERKIACRSSAAAMYGRLIDTPRLNRAIGNPHVDATKIDGVGGARFLVRGKLGGVPVTYEEHPFEWAHGRFFSFYRVLRGGPGRSVATRYDFEDVESGGSVVGLRVEAEARSALTHPIVWAATKLGVSPLVAFIERTDAEIAGLAPSEPPVAPPDRARLEALRSRLEPRHPAALVGRLVDLVSTGDELELASLRPFELADAWQADRSAVLRLCLDAVPTGLLELRWCMLCPSCRTSSERIPSLNELGTEGHCHACDLRFGVELDRAVEARFLPHPSVRRVDERPMCVAGPLFTPHVLAQAVVPAGEARPLRAPEAAGRYRVFVRGGAAAALEVATDAPASVTLSAASGTLVPAQVTVAPGGSVVIENGEAESRHAKLERTEWLFNAATAHHVATMPEFRALFGAQALRPGLALRISSVAILFSDLCGSTALYSRVGDAAAFGVVTDSFTFGTAIIEAHGGSVVKTMGDAIMAAFTDPDDAVAAGARLVREWSRFRDATPLAEHLEIKVGVVVGPCTVVTANRTLDYFGQTVNRAARVQHLAGPRQLVVPAELLSDEVPAGLRVVERFEATVKGIEEPIALVRLAVPP